MFDAIPTAMPFIKQGRVIALAVTSPQRMPILPDVPTLAESGLPGFSAVTWYGLFAPQGMSPALVQRIHAAFAAAIQAPEVIEKLAAVGAGMGHGSTADFVTTVADDSARWGRLIRERKITVD